MLIIALALLALATVPMTGGRLSRLAFVEFRAAWLVPLALGLQIVVISVVPEASHVVLATIHVATYALAVTFVLLNRRIPGLLLVGLGGACNGVAIALNGGTLPASAGALERAGIAVDPDEFTNSGVLEDPKLAWLGDQFAIPEWAPLANVFSVGDVLIVVGIVYGAHRICRFSAEQQPSDTEGQVGQTCSL